MALDRPASSTRSKAHSVAGTKKRPALPGPKFARTAGEAEAPAARSYSHSVIGWSHARTALAGRLKAASGRRCDMPDPNSIPLVHCSNCQALYQVVKAQAGPETVDLEIACRVCNGPLTAREGQFVLKYFLLREASRLDIRRAAQGFLRAKPAARRRKASVSSIKK